MNSVRLVGYCLIKSFIEFNEELSLWQVRQVEVNLGIKILKDISYNKFYYTILRERLLPELHDLVVGIVITSLIVYILDLL